VLLPHEEPVSVSTEQMDNADRLATSATADFQDKADIEIEVLLSFPELLRISAHEYADRGWAVFPLAAGTKLPHAGSRGFLDATLDHERIDSWWNERPNANIGIATGLSSGLWVLDVDPKNGGDVTFATLVAEHGFPTGLGYVLTPSGGRHYYFRRPEGLSWPSSKERLGPGLDVRADGGYVVAPPSVIANEGQYVEVRS